MRAPACEQRPSGEARRGCSAFAEPVVEKAPSGARKSSPNGDCEPLTHSRPTRLIAPSAAFNAVHINLGSLVSEPSRSRVPCKVKQAFWARTLFSEGSRRIYSRPLQRHYRAGAAMASIAGTVSEVGLFSTDLPLSLRSETASFCVRRS